METADELLEEEEEDDDERVKKKRAGLRPRTCMGNLEGNGTPVRTQTSFLRLYYGPVELGRIFVKPVEPSSDRLGPGNFCHNMPRMPFF